MKKMPEKRLRVKVNKCPVKMDIIMICNCLLYTSDAADE